MQARETAPCRVRSGYLQDAHGRGCGAEVHRALGRRCPGPHRRRYCSPLRTNRPTNSLFDNWLRKSCFISASPPATMGAA